MKTYGKGFIFYDGELKTFNPLTYTIRFFPEEVYRCTAEIGIGDDVTVVDLDMTNIAIYRNECDFRNAKRMDGDVVRFDCAFRNAFHFSPIDDGFGKYSAWEFADGEARMTNVSDLEFHYKCYNGCVRRASCDRTGGLYESSEKVYLHHDYVVDGETRVSPKSKLALTDEQRKYFDMFKESLRLLKESGVSVLHEISYDKFYFINRNNISDYTFYDPDVDHIEVECIVERIDDAGVNYMNFDNCDSLYARFK